MCKKYEILSTKAENQNRFFQRKSQYPANNKFNKMSGETARLRTESVGNEEGGKKGRIKDTNNKRAATMLSQKNNFPKN